MSSLSRRDVQLLKVVINILSRSPWDFGVVLEEGGWLDFKSLHKVLREEGIGPPSHKSLRRFFEVYRPSEIEIESGRLRSKNPSFQYEELWDTSYPEGTLYLGVRKKALQHVREHGLDSARRPLILSETKEMAERIIRRITGDFIIIEIDAYTAQTKGVRFRSLGGVLYTCPFLHPKWMKLPVMEEEADIEDKKEEQRSKKGDEKGETKEKQPPGSFYLTLAPDDIAYLEEKSGRRRDRWSRRHKKGKRRK